jgi:hypothetical protein
MFHLLDWMEIQQTLIIVIISLYIILWISSWNNDRKIPNNLIISLKKIKPKKDLKYDSNFSSIVIIMWIKETPLLLSLFLHEPFYD